MMNHRSTHIEVFDTVRIFSVLLLVMSACIEPFDVTYENDTSNVVITGSITDMEPAVVDITEPAPSPNTANINIPKISGALVLLVDDLANVDTLLEVSSGKYRGSVKGVVGRAYHLNVVLPDDQVIKSIPQLLKPSPSINNLSLKQVSMTKVFDSNNYKLEGISLDLTMNNQDTVSRFYKWTIQGTYKIYSAFDYSKTEPPCYVTLDKDVQIILGESISGDADIISQRLKLLTPNSTFAEGQSIEVSQYSMTEEAYEYWRKVEDQQKNVGSIFDPPPTQIVGNLYSQTHPEALVMGFFEASSVKKRRIYVDRLDFPSFTVSSDLGVNSRCFPPVGWIGPWVSPAYCEDCILLPNSTKIKPSYWPE
jgi:hypothetical protein